jgi:DNA-binding NtrC family response regulator
MSQTPESRNSQDVLVFCRDDALWQELGRQYAPEGGLRRCQSLDGLHEELAARPARVVLVHLGKTTLNGYSAGRFVAELDEAVDSAPLYGLVDPDCPPRLRKLADRAADACLPLPLDYDELRRLLESGHDPARELDGFWQGMPHKELHGQTRSLVSFTPAMFDTFEELKVAARHDVTVLLIGETGSGKTYLARLVHELSDRRTERFCTVACGALPPDLLESELFGHMKGSFTGADATREGKFAAAGRGTLLLDEIDVLPLEQQTKLLRVIETGEYEPVGSNETRRSEARLVVASNYHLEDLVRAGTFRTDLYYRLNILRFRVPPLRERPRDIEYLARKFALEHSRTHKIQLREIDPAFLEALVRYPWPGNIRELENVIRRAVLYCQRGVLAERDLPSAVRFGGSAALTPSQGAIHAPLGHGRPPGEASGQDVGRSSGPPLGVRAGSDTFVEDLSNPAARTQSPGKGSAGEAFDGVNAPATLEAKVDFLERKIIEESLRRNHYRRKETAAELGISRVTLYNKMKKLSIPG